MAANGSFTTSRAARIACAVPQGFVRPSGTVNGAGTMEHFAEAAEAGATVLLAASVFHFHIIGIPELKAFLKARGFSVRL